MQSSNPTTLVGSVFERPASTRLHHFQSTQSPKTGFPAVKHRSEHGISKGKSAFLKSRESSGTAKRARPPVRARDDDDDDPAPYAPPTEPIGDWRDQISRENEKKVAGMSPEEREREQQEIIARFGAGIGDILKKAREARLSAGNTQNGEMDAGMHHSFNLVHN